MAEGISKSYPVTPVRLFPPVTSMFERGWFSRNRSSEEEESEAKPKDGSERPADGRPAPRPRPQTRQTDDDLYDDDDDFDDDEDEDDDEGPVRSGGPTPERPGEMFWALKDVSFRVPPGAGLGVLGGPGAGKSTLLGILGGRTFPTEGRVLVRGRTSPVPAGLAKALGLTDKGTFSFSLPMACQLLGIEARLVKQHEDEIEDLAQPLVDEHGEPAPGAWGRLAVATAVVLPWSVILLEEGLRGTEGAFMAQIAERLRGRLQDGASLVLASRTPELVEELCDDVILLHEGSIMERGGASGVVGSYDAAQAAGDGERGSGRASGSDRSSGTLAPSRQHWDGGELRIPDVVPAFNGSAALLSATLRAGSGRSKKIDAADEVLVEIRLETAGPDVEAKCGVSFTPRNGEDVGIRVEHPEPLRFVNPGSYVLAARVLPGELQGGAFEVRVDAVVADPAEPGASVIARDIGRVRIAGDDLDATEPAEPAVPQWDGRLMRLAEADWSIE